MWWRWPNIITDGLLKKDFAIRKWIDYEYLIWNAEMLDFCSLVYLSSAEF